MAAVLVSCIHLINDKQDKRPITLESVFAGFSFIWNRQVLLGVMSLDLFVVLVGGITALLPIFAKDVLETGPWGLGLLRSAPAVGALTASVVLARWSIEAKAGKILFWSVAAFGVSISVFSLSTSLMLSLVALVGYGAADAISVVIRHSMVQTRTPTEMLGRVITVNSMFTGSSGSLGEFRAGLMAAWLGVVPAALFGGVGAIAVVFIWMRVFPEIARIDKLNVEEERQRDLTIAASLLQRLGGRATGTGCGGLSGDGTALLRLLYHSVLSPRRSKSLGSCSSSVAIIHSSFSWQMSRSTETMSA